MQALMREKKKVEEGKELLLRMGCLKFFTWDLHSHVTWSSLRCFSRPPSWELVQLIPTHLACYVHPSLPGLPPSSQEVRTVALIGQPEETADLVEAVGELGGKVKKRYNL